MEPIFVTETIHDLSVHTEFRQGYQFSSVGRGIINIFICSLVISFMFLFDSPRMVYTYLLWAAIMLLTSYLSLWQKRDIHYKRMLQANQGQPQHMLIEIYPTHIHCTDRRSGNTFDYPLNLFTRIIDTPHLLILGMQYRSCLILEKRWLRGGTIHDLTAFLLLNCPALKSKKAKRTGFGKWTHRIATVFLAVGLVIALCNLPGISLFSKLSGRLTNDMSYREMADALAPLGITISERTIRELEEYDAEYAAEYGEDFYADGYGSKISDLLYWEGSGIYDEETWEWTPSTSGIYWFDSEVMNVDSIYTDFLTGVSAMNPDLSFSSIREDYSKVDLEAGTGTVIFSFDWQGRTYRMEAAYNYDWFDTAVLDEMCSIIESDGTEKRLYYAFDGGQGFFLYYGTPDCADTFEQITDIYFTDSHFFYP